MNNEQHLDFCKKYPETVFVYENGNLQYMIDNNITPVVDFLKVGELVHLYNKNPEVFTEYRTLREDWNDLISQKNKL